MSQIQIIQNCRNRRLSPKDTLHFTWCNWDSNPNSLRNLNILKSCSGLHKVQYHEKQSCDKSNTVPYLPENKGANETQKGCRIYTLINYCNEVSFTGFLLLKRCNWDTNPNSLRNLNVLKSSSGLHKVLMDKFSFTIFTSLLKANDRLILTIKVWLAIFKHMNSTLQL